MFKSAIRQALVVIIIAALFSIGYNSIREDGIPIFTEKVILEQAQMSDLEKDSNGENYVPEIKEVTLELAKEMFDRGIVFIDARDEIEYKLGHISGARNLSIVQLAERLPLDKPVVIYCSGDGCDISFELAESMADFGFLKLFVFYGGWPEWINAGYPIETD